MRFRIDFTLMQNARISIFRQNLINDGNTPIKMSITNLTENELARGFKELIANSKYYIEKNILKGTEDGVVELCIYDTPKKMPSVRNVTFSNLIGAKDYTYKILDTKEKDVNSLSFYDSSVDITTYLKHRGKPVQLEKEIKIQDEEITEVSIEENKISKEIIQNEERQKINLKKNEIQNENETEKEVEENKFVCEVEGCGKEYATERGYKNHMKKVHGIEI